MTTTPSLWKSETQVNVNDLAVSGASFASQYNGQIASPALPGNCSKLTNFSVTGVKGYLVQGDVNGNGQADFSLQIYTSPTANVPGGPDAWNLASWHFIL